MPQNQNTHAVQDAESIKSYVRTYIEGAMWWEIAYNPANGPVKCGYARKRALYMDSLAVSFIAHKPNSVQDRAFLQYNDTYDLYRKVGYRRLVSGEFAV